MTDKESPVIGQRFDDDIADETRAIGTGSEYVLLTKVLILILQLLQRWALGGRLTKNPMGLSFHRLQAKMISRKRQTKGEKKRRLRKLPSESLYQRISAILKEQQARRNFWETRKTSTIDFI